MLLIFDLDGTLIDSKCCIVKATQEAFGLHGLPAPSENQIVDKMGIPIEVTFPEWSGWTNAQLVMGSYRSLYGELSRAVSAARFEHGKSRLGLRQIARKKLRQIICKVKHTE